MSSNDTKGNFLGAISSTAILALVMTKINLDRDSQQIVIYVVPTVSILFSTISIKVSKHYHKKSLIKRNFNLIKIKKEVRLDDTLSENQKEMHYITIDSERTTVLSELIKL